MEYRILSVSFIAMLAILSASAQALISMEIEAGGDSFKPGTSYLDSVVLVHFNEFIDSDAKISIFIDGETMPREVISLAQFLKDEDEYNYRNESFEYIIKASGITLWHDYPEQDFEYTYRITGLCGGDHCIEDEIVYCDCNNLCSPPYPCEWEIDTSSSKPGKIDGSPETGLKFIVEIGEEVLPTHVVNGSVDWFAIKEPSSPPEVEVSMRQICGTNEIDSFYDGTSVWDSGWLVKYLHDPTNTNRQLCNRIPGSLDCQVTMLPFDEESLNNREKYGGPPGDYTGGGIFKNYVGGDLIYQRVGHEVEVDGDNGVVRIKEFEDNAYYTMVYLSGDGPHVCAYTSHKDSHSTTWDNDFIVRTASAGYSEPYSRIYDIDELTSISELSEGGCPPGYSCQYVDYDYYVEEYDDPEDTIDITSHFNGEKLFVDATADTKLFSITENIRINLSEYDISISDLTDEVGEHSMRLLISSGFDEISEKEFDLFICSDNDGDGFCVESGDCNDTNPDVHPLKEEVCNGIDEDCDGFIDNGIAIAGQIVGEPCDDWDGNLCKGVFTCINNGTNITCTPINGIYPGDKEEICLNRIDDDCDGTVDEQTEIINGTSVFACVDKGEWCEEGETRACGQCKDGLRHCEDGQFGPCIDESDPKAEVCNRADDDCDGVVDNLGGGTSIESTLCGCFDQKLPKIEVCNGIDDDCDGKIDEGVANCCDEGTTRICGSDVGVCEYGIETCIDGQWGLCEGATNPRPSETCCNDVDDDCDGGTDEGCTAPCSDINAMTMVYWAIIGIVVALVFGIVLIRQFSNKGSV